MKMISIGCYRRKWSLLTGFNKKVCSKLDAYPRVVFFKCHDSCPYTLPNTDIVECMCINDSLACIAVVSGRIR